MTCGDKAILTVCVVLCPCHLDMPVGCTLWGISWGAEEAYAESSTLLGDFWAHQPPNLSVQTTANWGKLVGSPKESMHELRAF